MKIVLLLVLSFFLSFCSKQETNTNAVNNQSAAANQTIGVKAPNINPETDSKKNTSDSFQNLSKLEVEKDENPVSVYYSPAKASLVNQKASQLNNSSPFYVSPQSEEAECEGKDVLVLKTKVDSKDYALVYASCPEKQFLIYEENGKEKKEVGNLPAETLYLPEDGAFYVSAQSQFKQPVKMKYVIKNGQLSEVKQPYYFVGINLTSNEEIAVYDSFELKNKIASIAKGKNMELLLTNDLYSDKYLAKTEFGLVGWIQINSCSYLNNCN
ncbi:MAG TPA: hypothetical protein DHW82_10350 [Spirochaetia bacterium]|nr:MAG: hypothetical protein A2Y41_13660 [Spirochaetes bacterium GWB1_36_13]HCL57392.1 hypothetical protein [Spirochaetia bacterium]